MAVCSISPFYFRRYVPLNSSSGAPSNRTATLNSLPLNLPLTTVFFVVPSGCVVAYHQKEHIPQPISRLRSAHRPA